MRFFFSLSLVLFLPAVLCDRLLAQETSPHRLQSEHFGGYGIDSERGWDSVWGRSPAAVRPGPFSAPGRTGAEPCSLTRIVFGWNPYWMGTAYEEFDFSLLSDISYFSYETDPATGNYTTVHSWETTNLIPMAQAAGTRVHLCVTLFSGHATFFGNPDAQRRLIDSLTTLVKRRGADGVNVDFEGVPGAQRANLANFMRDLGTRFHQEIPGSQVSIDIPAVDWSNSFDVEAMLPYVDLFIIMGYDYHWAGAPNTGPVSPRNNGDIWSAIDVTRSVRNYLAENIPPEKLCLGLPWYGYDWPAANEQPGAQTQGRGTAKLYGNIREELTTIGRERMWDRHSSTPWFAYQDAGGLWRQTWYDDAESLGLKYDMLTTYGLAGTAIWALGYDRGYPELWDLLREKFTDCGASPCTGTISDMGGPQGQYFPNEDWTYTIAPQGATAVTLSFDTFPFDLADDHLYVYEGDEASGSPIINLTGKQRPDSLTVQNGAMTLRFVSNGLVFGEGFEASWSCSTVPLSVDDAASLSFAVAVHPNPTTGKQALLQADLPTGGTIRLALFDLTGRELGGTERRLEAGRNTISIAALLAGRRPGAYLLRAEGAGEIRGVTVWVR